MLWGGLVDGAALLREPSAEVSHQSELHARCVGSVTLLTSLLGEGIEVGSQRTCTQAR